MLFWINTGEFIIFIKMVIEKEAPQGEGDEAKSKKALKKQAKEAEKAAKKEARKSANVSFIFLSSFSRSFNHPKILSAVFRFNKST